MSARLPRIDPSALLVGALALAAAAVLGALLGQQTSLGVIILGALALVTVVATSIPAGLAVWVAALFLSGVPALQPLPHAAAVLVLALWLANARLRAEPVVARHGRLLGVMVLLLVWLSLTLAWARSRSLVFEDLIVWYVAAVLYIIVATTLVTPESVRLVAAAFVFGAVVAVILGFVQDDIRAVANSLETAQQGESRFQGASDDPNYLAAGLIPAMALAIGLRAGTRRPFWRLLLLVAVGVLAIGLAATESRGGYVAAVVALAASLVVFRRRRVWVVVAVILAAAGSALWLQSSETSQERIRSAPDDGASGRIYLWDIAWEMAQDHPVIGVGLNNYVLRSRDYAGAVGTTDRGELIFTSPKVAHSVYLQLLAETGFIGLALYGLLVVGSLWAAWTASLRFDRLGQPSLAILAQSVIAGAIGLLAAAAFLTIGWDRRLWFLLALGPALHVMARRAEEDYPRTFPAP